MHSNPNNPVVLLVNALKCISLSIPRSLWGVGFSLGWSQYDSNTKVISDIIKYHEYYLDSYDKVENLSLHSVQKGSDTCVLSETTVGPKIIES